MGANLIVHQCMANIFHQGVEPQSILGVVEKVRAIVSGCYRVHGPADLFQFPVNPHESDSILDLGECRLTVPVFPLALSH